MQCIDEYGSETTGNETFVSLEFDLRTKGYDVLGSI